jgi:predicted nucleotidyltransferase
VFRTKDCLSQIVFGRVSAAGRTPKSYFDEASEVIVFGSMAVGLDRPNSDVDVMCIGGRQSKLKTHSLDLIVFSEETAKSQVWLQSELALHISHYGVWIKGKPDWIDYVRVGKCAIEEKRRRVEAFMRHLPDSWSRLDEGFRVKYAIKVRREAQRLLLISRGVPVPPTRMLDTCWHDFSESHNELDDLLNRFAPRDRNEFSRQFPAYIEANLHRSHA